MIYSNNRMSVLFVSRTTLRSSLTCPARSKLPAKRLRASCGIYYRATKDKFGELKSVLREFLNKLPSSEQIIFLSFRHWDKKRLKLAIWSAVIGMFYIFRNKDAGTSDMLLYLRKELFFHVLLERWFAGRVNMSKMMDVLNRKIGGV